MIHVVVVLIKAYFGDLDFLFSLQISILLTLQKGLFLQLQNMSLSFHIRFVLTVLPLFFYFLRTRTISVAGFCRTRAVSGMPFYLFFVFCFFLTWVRRDFVVTGPSPACLFFF